ncbi:MAG: A/G-specific adenine glycosylase [Isosphaeraceae bacterium]
MSNPGRGRRAKGDGGAGGGDSPDQDPAWVSRIRERLLDWYAGARRPLPWRADRDPYRVLVSEMMLVQTTVAAVVPYFERFLRRFPDVRALADADEADVLKAWEGLGYYRRARQLHAAARAVVERHGGRVPDDPEALRELPGVGRYIAGAVLSFAFDRPAPILEANTQRVVARWLAWPGDLKSPATQARLWEAAGRLVPETRAGDFNQAFMELGALVCTPRSPRCLVCPVSADCLARARGKQDELPVVAPRPAPLEVVEACAVVRHGGRLLLLQRGAGGLWEGFWEFPTVHVSGADPAGRRESQGNETDVAKALSRLTGLDLEVGPSSRTLRYVVTKHKVRLEVHEAEARSDAAFTPPGYVSAAWVAPETLGQYLLGTPGRRISGGLGGGGGGRGKGRAGGPA